MIDDAKSWLQGTGLPLDGPAEVVVTVLALTFAGWFILHLLFDD